TMHMARGIRQIFASLGIWSIFCCCPALAAPTTPPNAGAILSEQKENLLPQPVKPALRLEIDKQNETTPAVAGPKILVNRFHITGQTIYPESELLMLVSESAGKELTLGELQALARSVAKYFHKQGYLVANAYIPAQQISDGVVEIAVVVGQYGKIDIRNHSGLRTSKIEEYLSNIKSGDTIQNSALEATLLLLSDVPGLSAKATLAAGATGGTSDLIVDISDTEKFSGLIFVDNAGNRYTGKNRLGAAVNVNNISGVGDLFSLGATYTGSGMNDYNISYTLPLGARGKIGARYSQMHYLLGDDFADLSANGLAKTTGIYTSYVFKRSRNFNLMGRVEYDSKDLIDQIDATSSYSQKKVDAWVIGLNGSSRDQLWGGGVNYFGLSYTRGHLNLLSADAMTNDSNAQTAGDYGKTNFELSRIQALNNRLNLHLSLVGQLAGKNLDSSEKLQIGGPYGVRAYPVGEAASDAGYIFSGELRWNLPTPRFQVAAFYDHGVATLNKDPWTGSGQNLRVLGGAGIGLIWSRPGDYSLRLDYAWQTTTSEQAVSDSNSNGRFWLRATKFF
ncbi:MAG TPA: ShlB/FhaC/HecB family hemolysin secretion/activation protein, partial [Negativicutes bacterium]|nr:ShlB/FhaC/HecB family hemolysin secretion/activation protein [Negativicutes bacterium]